MGFINQPCVYIYIFHYILISTPSPLGDSEKIRVPTMRDGLIEMERTMTIPMVQLMIKHASEG